MDNQYNQYDQYNITDKKSKIKPSSSPLSSSLSPISSPSLECDKNCSKKKCVIEPVPKEIMLYKAIVTLLALYTLLKHKEEFTYKQIVMALLFPEIFIVYSIVMNRVVLN